MSNTLLIIPSYLSSQKHALVLMKCIGSIRACGIENEILIVDDGSPTDCEHIYEEAKDWHRINYHLKEENSGFSSTVNIGLARALSEGRDACLINADIEFKEKDWLSRLEKSKGDIVGGLLLYPNLLIQHAGIYFSHITRSFDHRFTGSPPNLPAAQESCDCPVTGALQFIRHHVMTDVGIYDEEFKMGHEDVDFMIRAISEGHKSLYNPQVKAIHHESFFRKETSDKLREWQDSSYLRLLSKYKDTNFSDIVPILWS